MIKFFLFVVARYATAFSYVAAFLLGVSVVLPIAYMAFPFLAAILLGSLAAFCKRFLII